MLNIRSGLFETNSSSVHCMTLLTEDEYNKWNTGEYYLDMYNNTILSEDEVEIIISEYANKWGYNIDDVESVEEILQINNIYSESAFYEYTEDYKTFEEAYNKDGQFFYAIGYTGYNG